MDINNILLEKFNSGEAENIGIKRIFELFEAKTQFEKDIIRKAVAELEEKGEIVYRSGKYVKTEHSDLIKGTLRGNERGFAFLISDKGDYFIPHKSLNGAFNGDTVLARQVKGNRGSNDEGEVVRILSRGVSKLVGTFEGENGFGFVIPDNRAFSVDIYVPDKHTMGAKTGDKVLTIITGYPENRKNPEGKVVAVLGRRFDLKTEELSIILDAGYATEFPEKVLKEVESLPDKVEKKDLKGRIDFTKTLTVTIDGDDARDFDDAVSVSENSDGTFTLGVHIADVTNYVKRGSAVYKEALKRSTSVYFPERVIPMLPEKLSNGLCSLNEGEIRLTVSCIMTVDKNGNVSSADIKEGYIKSQKRLTYSVVQKMLDGDEEVIKNNKAVYPMIKTAEKLKNVLSARRSERGSIELKGDECNISVKNGKIFIEPRKDSGAYKIIEEFMIAANEAVAEFAFYTDAPFCYRIHERPDPEKLLAFKSFLNALGVNVRWNENTCHPKDFATLSESLKDTDIYGIVDKVMLRSMKKAIYSTENKGHFGLSSKCYCHFTSPIRRFPDLTVHEILKGILRGENVREKYNDLEEICRVSTMNERKADEAEREMDDYYKCRYMRSYIGDEFRGVISGVTNFGVFVELENTVEGIVRVETLPRGTYKFDEKTFTLYSKDRFYTLGESVTVKILNADTASRKVEMKITEDKYFRKNACNKG